MEKMGIGPKTNDWTEVCEDPTINSEELIVRNTYVNAQVGQIVDFIAEEIEVEECPASKVSWTDSGQDIKDELVNNENHDCLNEFENGYVHLKSCFKGATKQTLKVSASKVEQQVNLTNADNSNTQSRKTDCNAQY